MFCYLLIFSSLSSSYNVQFVLIYWIRKSSFNTQFTNRYTLTVPFLIARVTNPNSIFGSIKHRLLILSHVISALRIPWEEHAACRSGTAYKKKKTLPIIKSAASDAIDGGNGRRATGSASGVCSFIFY